MILKFVVLDEPTNGLDPNQILEVRQLIQNIAEDRTVLLSTHILSEVQAACSSIKMIEHGHVVFSGTVESLIIISNLIPFTRDLILPPTIDELVALPGIRRAEFSDDHGVRLSYDGDRDTIKNMIRESVSRGWEMTEVKTEKTSMEAIFAKLSGK